MLWVYFLYFFINSELDKYEESLKDLQKYKDFLFRLSPPEWQDEQKTKASRSKTSDEQSDGQEIPNKEPTEIGI